MRLWKNKEKKILAIFFGSPLILLLRPEPQQPLETLNQNQVAHNKSLCSASKLNFSIVKDSTSEILPAVRTRYVLQPHYALLFNGSALQVSHVSAFQGQSAYSR